MVLSPDYQTIETVDPKKLPFPQSLLLGEGKGRVLMSAEEELVSQKEITHGSVTLQENSEVQTRKGQGRVGPHLGQDCLDVYSPSLLPKLQIHFRIPIDGLVRVPESVCPSSQCGHIE